MYNYLLLMYYFFSRYGPNPIFQHSIISIPKSISRIQFNQSGCLINQGDADCRDTLPFPNHPQTFGGCCFNIDSGRIDVHCLSQFGLHFLAVGRYFGRLGKQGGIQIDDQKSVVDQQSASFAQQRQTGDIFIRASLR